MKPKTVDVMLHTVYKVYNLLMLKAYVHCRALLTVTAVTDCFANHEVVPSYYFSDNIL